VTGIDDLRNGEVLCKAINGMKPGAIGKINTYNSDFRRMENIDNFLKVCTQAGVAPEHLCSTEDLFYGNNFPKVGVERK